MIRLFAVRAVIAVWFRSIRISDKLRSSTWKALTYVSLALLAISCFAVLKSFRNTQPSTVTFVTYQDPTNAIRGPFQYPYFPGSMLESGKAQLTNTQTINFAIRPNYMGYLDVADCNTIFGWTANTNGLNTPTIVGFSYGNTLLQKPITEAFTLSIAGSNFDPNHIVSINRGNDLFALYMHTNGGLIKSGANTASITAQDHLHFTLAPTVDVDGDTLLYSYTVTGSRIAGEGANVSWDLSAPRIEDYSSNSGQPANRMMTFSLASNGTSAEQYSRLNWSGGHQIEGFESGNSLGQQKGDEGGILQSRLVGGSSESPTVADDYVSRLKQLFTRDSSARVQLLLPEDAFRQDLFSWASLMCSLITTIANMIFLWISLHRRRADEILLRLKDQEIQQLKIALEEERLKAEGQLPHLIIVPS